MVHIFLCRFQPFLRPPARSQKRLRGGGGCQVFFSYFLFCFQPFLRPPAPSQKRLGMTRVSPVVDRFCDRPPRPRNGWGGHARTQDTAPAARRGATPASQAPLQDYTQHTLDTLASLGPRQAYT